MRSRCTAGMRASKCGPSEFIIMIVCCVAATHASDKQPAAPLSLSLCLSLFHSLFASRSTLSYLHYPRFPPSPHHHNHPPLLPPRADTNEETPSNGHTKDHHLRKALAFQSINDLRSDSQQLPHFSKHIFAYDVFRAHPARRSRTHPTD